MSRSRRIGRERFGRGGRIFTVAGALAMVALAGCFVSCGPGDDPREIVVFAAASLRDVMLELGATYERETGVRVVFNFAGSNVLARQLSAAPKADLFLSANERWMNYADESGVLVPGSRRPVLSNALVVVTNLDNTDIIEGSDGLCRAEFTYLALADPRAVPAGVYAKEWMATRECGDSTVWNTVRGRTAPTADVRSALALVEANRAVIGIVYLTDAMTSNRVRVAYRVPVSEGPAIVYSIALVAGRMPDDAAVRFLTLLESPDGRHVFERYGFIPVQESGR